MDGDLFFDGARARMDMLQAGLDLIDQGFTLFDRDLKLVAANRAFATLLEFPLQLMRIGTPFEAFMRYNAERGEYGPGPVEDLVAERMEAARRFTPHYAERVRPGGQIIAIRGEPLPHRGFVTLYTDITAQRKAEQLIRERNADLERRVQARTQELERAQAALMQAQKMEAVGQLAGGIAHDLNNMLTVVLGNLSALEERMGNSVDACELVEPALLATRRGAGLIRRLLTFAHQQPLEPLPVDVAELVREFQTLLRRSLPENIELKVRFGDGLVHALTDPSQFENALLNLALNARDAMPAGGTLDLCVELRAVDADTASALSLQPGSYVRIMVADNGHGMDSRTLMRACEPFFTTKQFGNGSGLGLAMVYGFTRQSGGALLIESEPGAGTEVSLYLPAAEESPQPAANRGKTAAPRQDSPLVLLVEDNAEVRQVVRRQLLELGCKVVEAADGREALDLLRQIIEIEILISDVVMPGGIDGPSLAREARAQRPGMRILLISGYDQGNVDTGEFRLLDKPFTKAALGAALDACKP